MSLSLVRQLHAWAWILLLPISLQAKKEYNWTDNPPPASSFTELLNRIWAAAAEREPFESIKGKPLFDRPGWSTTAVLPGGKDCWLTLNKQNLQTSYMCVSYLKNVSETQKAAAQTGAFVEVSQPGWKAIVQPPISPSISTVLYVQASEWSLDREDFIKPGSLVREVYLDVKQQTFTFMISSHWQKGSLEELFGKVVDSGRYEPLPKPQISPEPSSPIGSVTVSITNNTPFAVDLYAAGPGFSGRRLLPHTAHNFTFPPGSYKILGRMLASKAQVDAGFDVSRLTSFYGSQDFEAGTRYAFSLDPPANLAVPAPKSQVSAEGESDGPKQTGIPAASGSPLKDAGTEQQGGECANPKPSSAIASSAFERFLLGLNFGDSVSENIHLGNKQNRDTAVTVERYSSNGCLLERISRTIPPEGKTDVRIGDYTKKGRPEFDWLRISSDTRDITLSSTQEVLIGDRLSAVDRGIASLRGPSGRLSRGHHRWTMDLTIVPATTEYFVNLSGHPVQAGICQSDRPDFYCRALNYTVPPLGQVAFQLDAAHRYVVLESTPGDSVAVPIRSVDGNTHVFSSSTSVTFDPGEAKPN